MAKITVTMTEQDVIAACADWAVTRVLNEGTAVGSTIEVVEASTRAAPSLLSVKIEVETDRMKQPPSDRIRPVVEGTGK